MTDSIHEQFDEETEIEEPTTETAEQTTAEPEVEERESETSEATPPKETESQVPYGALHEERQMRKELQQQLNETQRALGQFQSLKDELEEIRKGKQEDAVTEQMARIEAQFEDDPIGALKQQQELLQKQLQERQVRDNEQEQTARQQQEQQAQMQQMLDTVRSQVIDFEKDHPDYPEAFNYVMERRIGDYRALGITDPHQIQMEFDREAIAMSANALQRGINPGQAVYDLAKNWGYTQSTDKKTDLEETMNTLERGQQASQTLSGEGSAPDGKLTVSQIEKMSDDEFDKLWDNMAGGSIYE